jgi:hypothetical protein
MDDEQADGARALGESRGLNDVLSLHAQIYEAVFALPKGEVGICSAICSRGDQQQGCVLISARVDRVKTSPGFFSAATVLTSTLGLLNTTQRRNDFWAAMIALYNDRSQSFIRGAAEIQSYLDKTARIVALVDCFIDTMQAQQEYIGFLSLEFYGKSELYSDRLERKRKTVTPRELIQDHPTYNALHYALYFSSVAQAMQTLNSMLISQEDVDAFGTEQAIVSFWQRYQDTHPQAHAMQIDDDDDDDDDDEDSSDIGSLEVMLEDDEQEFN